MARRARTAAGALCAVLLSAGAATAGLIGSPLPAGASVTGIDTPPPTGSGGFYGATGNPITTTESGSSVTLVVTAEQLGSTVTADGSIQLTWNPSEFTLIGSGSDTSGVCTTSSASLDCHYTDMSHTYKSVAYKFRAVAPDATATITATAQTDGLPASEQFSLFVRAQSPIGQISTVGSASTYVLMHNLFRTSLNDLLPGGTTADQVIAKTALLCRAGVTYQTSGAPDGGPAGDAALVAEQTASSTMQGCVDFVRSAMAPTPTGTPAGSAFDYYAYALDAVAPLVGTNAGGTRGTPVTLSLSQLKAIYHCMPGSTNWKAVTGGRTGTIVRYWPATGSDARSFYAAILGFTPAVAATKGTCPSPAITAVTVGGLSKSVSDTSEAGIIVYAAAHSTAPVADAISLYSAGTFASQWNTTSSYGTTRVNPLTGTAIGNFKASALLLAQVENRATDPRTAPFSQ